MGGYKMHTEQNYIGDCSSLIEGERGLCFEVKDDKSEISPAFVIAYDGCYRAYLNRCGHIAVRLDFQEGDFFGDDGQTLVCATHGAEYSPETGACLGGPCYGVGLETIKIAEQDGRLFLVDDRYRVCP